VEVEGPRRDAKARGRIQQTAGAYFTDAVAHLAAQHGHPVDASRTAELA
jgi:hypothetical protein